MISVIIPSYNRAGTIVRSVQSVLNQTYRNIEVIIVDDGSTDSTQEVIESLNNPLIRYFKLEENKGQCLSRNYGITQARGEYIAFQDSDDEWLPDKLEKQFAVFLNHPEVDVCFCQKRRIHLDGSIYIPHKNDVDGILTFDQVVNIPKVSTQTIMAKREVFEEFSFDPSIKSAVDYDWSICASDKYTFYFLKEPLVNQYLQADSITTVSAKTLTKVDSLKAILEKHRPELDRHPDLEKYINVFIYKLTFDINVKSQKPIYKEAWALFKSTHGKRYLMDIIYCLFRRPDKYRL